MRVAIIDDDRIVCDSLAIILGAQPDIEVCGIGATGDDAVRIHADAAPDVLLMDIQMPVCDGLSAAESIIARDPQARVVFLTTFSDDEYIVRALRLGARGYLIKQDVAKIPPALRAVMGGQSVLEGEVLERVTALRDREPASPAPGAGGFPPSFSQLTDREREVARLIAEGLDNKEIAAAAYMGEGTVRNHISSILSKLHLKNRTQIAIAWYRADG